MRKVLLLVVVVSLFAPAASAADLLTRAAPAMTAAPLTFQGGLKKKEKDLREFWFKNRDGSKKRMSCDFSCTNYCNQASFWCAVDCGSWEQNPSCREQCCVDWRFCMTINQCCTEPPAPEACPG